ncbi:MAG: formylglycine-generating enzyme family protein, partial [Microcystis panniformis]
VIKKEKRQAEGIVEKLAEGVELELMEIPGGTFMMGTEDEEIERLVKKFGCDGFRREKPPHRVTVSSFYMGRYPITQAQWQAIAATAKIDISLETKPSHFKGDELPVEQVKWYQAREFCKRLSRETKREYRLPSEAEFFSGHGHAVSRSYSLGKLRRPLIFLFTVGCRFYNQPKLAVGTISPVTIIAPEDASFHLD